MRKLIVAALVGTIAAAALGAGTSSATAPGKNGVIAFRRFLDRNQTRGAIFTINPDGTGVRQITHPPRGIVDDQPDWSSDGSLIAFTTNRDRLTHHRQGWIFSAVYTMAPDGSDLTRVSAACPDPVKPNGCPFDYQPAVSPDGALVAFTSGQGNIVVADGDGRHAHVLVEATAETSSDTGFTLSDPQFSPDGKRLLYVRENRGAAEPKDGVAIFTVAVNGTGRRQVTPWRLAGGDGPDWSPDGKRILFRTNVNSDKAQSQIDLIRPDGTGLRQLTTFERNTIVTSSSFSPDGKWIVYGSTGVAGQADLFVMRAHGGGVRRLTRTSLWDSAPDWGPSR